MNLIYSFFDKKQFTKEEVLKHMEKSNKEFKYTHGLGYRNPTTHKKPITKEKALNLVKTKGLVDVREYDDYIEVNTYSGNDMW